MSKNFLRDPQTFISNKNAVQELRGGGGGGGCSLKVWVKNTLGGGGVISILVAELLKFKDLRKLIQVTDCSNLGKINQN